MPVAPKSSLLGASAANADGGSSGSSSIRGAQIHPPVELKAPNQNLSVLRQLRPISFNDDRGEYLLHQLAGPSEARIQNPAFDATPALVAIGGLCGLETRLARWWLHQLSLSRY